MMKGQKGITLVALIITIIVMLILVGVSISVALNGGLFTKAGTASRQTKQAQLSEAVAQAKAEILSDFYSAKTNADRELKEESEMIDLIQGYLDKENILVKDLEPVENKTNVWTVKSDDVDYEGTEKEPVLDLSGITFAPAGGEEE